VRREKKVRGNETWLLLEWKESGMASHPVEQRREGFGTILLRLSLPETKNLANGLVRIG